MNSLINCLPQFQLALFFWGFPFLFHLGLFLFLPILADSFWFFYRLDLVWLPVLRDVTLCDKIPLELSDAVFLISWAGCLRNTSYVVYVGFPVLFWSWFLLPHSLVCSLLCLADWGLTPTTSCTTDRIKRKNTENKTHISKNNKMSKKQPNLC